MKSSLFNLSHTVLLSCNQGDLVPIGLTEVLPGDSLKHSAAALIRVQPLLAPIMHRVEAKIHHWFVPTRLIWEDFEDFITGGPSGTDASVPPYVTSPASTGFAIGSLADYFGVPPGFPDVQLSALPFRAYALIYNNFYRDQDLISELTISLASGSDTTTSVALQKACWEKDYFTSSRVTPQKGADVALPLVGDAPVTGIGIGDRNFAGSGAVYETGKGGTSTNYAHRTPASGGQIYVEGTAASSGNPEIYADLSAVSAASIEDLRLATALQRYKENMMRFGSRYIERLRYFGVPPMDARLQLPEYLGGGKQTLQFSEVLQTAPAEIDSEVTPVGELRGHGISAMRSNAYRRYIPEHGYIISLLVVRPKTMYPQALHRTWLRKTKEDYFTPELQHLGQQEVYDGEVYMGAASQYNTWGYQDRYDEYRRMESRVAGEFRDTLDFWHMARIFSGEPNLNADFVKADPTDRVYATDQDQLYVQVLHNLRAKRKLTKVARPMLF